MYILHNNKIILAKLATYKELTEGVEIDLQDILIDFDGYTVFKLNNVLELKFKKEMEINEF